MLSKRKRILTVYLGAILGVVAYQPFNIWFASLIFIAVLLYAIRGLPPHKSFLYGYLFGAIFYITLLYWIAWATFFGALPVPFIFAFIPAIFCWLFSRLERINFKLAVISAPFIWVATEYIRTFGQMAFPWNPVGNCFAAYPRFIQYAEYTGVWGISLWALIINMLFYLILIKPAAVKRVFGLSVLIILLIISSYIYGANVIPAKIEKEGIKVALLQGNIGRDIKWAPGKLNVSFDRYIDMTDSLRGSDVKLIVWPETAIPAYLRHHRVYNSIVSRRAERYGIPILTGSPDYIEVGKDKYIYYNAAFYYKPGKSSPRIYYKLKLVPFSERIPFSGKIKILRDIHLGQADFTPGDSTVLFGVDGYRFGVLICFELVFPDLVRSYLERGADFMITITNDMWFGITSGPYQHLYAGTIRAVENRVGIARCANTGISLFYDPYGRIYDMSKLNERKIIVDKVAFNKKHTFYTKHGDYLAKWSSGIAIILILIIAADGVILRRRSKF